LEVRFLFQPEFKGMGTNMNTKHRTNVSVAFIFTASDDELLEALDVLVANAAAGDRNAVGAIAIAFGPVLLDEARNELGRVHEQDAGDVVQQFYLELLEGILRFPAIRGAAIPWMKRMVRVIARVHVRGHPPDWGSAA
jgi:hypothetical protein